MEDPLFKPSTDVDLLLKPSETQSFYLANGINNHINVPLQFSSIEMITVQSTGYISLKDMIPSSPSSSMSPQYSRKDSWREIPIKDPLLKHAAWAYLRPMSTEPESDERSCLSKLKDGLLGCFGGLFHDVVMPTIKSWFASDEV